MGKESSLSKVIKAGQKTMVTIGVSRSSENTEEVSIGSTSSGFFQRDPSERTLGAERETGAPEKPLRRRAKRFTYKLDYPPLPTTDSSPTTTEPQRMRRSWIRNPRTVVRGWGERIAWRIVIREGLEFIEGMYSVCVLCE